MISSVTDPVDKPRSRKVLMWSGDVCWRRFRITNATRQIAPINIARTFSGRSNRLPTGNDLGAPLAARGEGCSSAGPAQRLELRDEILHPELAG